MFSFRLEAALLREQHRCIRRKIDIELMKIRSIILRNSSDSESGSMNEQR